jgi:SAM-dependent methyltransferase
MTKQIIYDGWELEFFDKADNFRDYQFDLIKDNLKGHVAEIGPGNGIFFDRYKNIVEEVDLYEPSINFLKNLKSKKKKNTQIINSNFFEKPNCYDTILYLDVFEHIEDDILEFEKAYKSLKKNGCLIINVPAFQHLYSKFDKDINHFRRYSKSSLLKLINNFNFNKVDLKYYDSIGYMLSLASKNSKLDYKKNFSIKIKVWDKLIKFSRIIDFLIFNKVGKSLIVKCTK